MTINGLLEEDDQTDQESDSIPTVSTGKPQGLSNVHRGYREAEHGEKPRAEHTPAAFYVTEDGTAFLKRNSRGLNGELEQIKKRADLAEDQFGIEIAGELTEQSASSDSDEYTPVELDNALVQSETSARYDTEKGFLYDQGPEDGDLV